MISNYFKKGTFSKLSKKFLVVALLGLTTTNSFAFSFLASKSIDTEISINKSNEVLNEIVERLIADEFAKVYYDKVFALSDAIQASHIELTNDEYSSIFTDISENRNLDIYSSQYGSQFIGAANELIQFVQIPREANYTELNDLNSDDLKYVISKYMKDYYLDTRYTGMSETYRMSHAECDEDFAWDYAYCMVAGGIGVFFSAGIGTPVAAALTALCVANETRQLIACHKRA